MCANGVLCKMAVLLLVPRLGTAAAAAVGTDCIGVSLLFRACYMHPLGTVALLQHATLLATVLDPQRKMFGSMSMTCKVPFTCPSLCCDLICCWYYYNCMITLNYLSVQGCGACVPCEVCAIQHGSSRVYAYLHVVKFVVPGRGVLAQHPCLMRRLLKFSFKACADGVMIFLGQG